MFHVPSLKSYIVAKDGKTEKKKSHVNVIFMIKSERGRMKMK